jgi:hypothetical protein
VAVEEHSGLEAWQAHHLAVVAALARLEAARSDFEGLERELSVVLAGLGATREGHFEL